VENAGRLEVVGVARDTRSERYGVVDGPRFYRLQSPRSFGGPLMARFDGDAGTVKRAIRDILRSVGGELIAAPKTLQSEIDDRSAAFWRMAQLVLLLGCAAVLLAVIGIYGVVSFVVSQRTREFGIRVALGATKTDLVRSVLRPSVKPVIVGVAVGLGLALAGSGALARLVQDAQLGLDTRDPITYIAATSILIFAALAAMLRPAFRAACGYRKPRPD
jgi:ABC-type antimicrobial peptide transport system permease subunit